MLMRRRSLRAIQFTLASRLQLSAAVAMTLGRAVGLRPERPTEKRLFLHVWGARFRDANHACSWAQPKTKGLDKVLETWRRKTALLLWMKTPELIVASILILIAVSGLVWWLSRQWDKGTIAALNTRIATSQDTHNGQIAALNTQIASLEGRLGDTREDLGAAKEEVRYYQEGYRVATDKQEYITRQVEFLTAEITKQTSTIELLKATAPPVQQPQLTTLASSTATMAGNIGSLSQANTALGTTLTITARKLSITFE